VAFLQLKVKPDLAKTQKVARSKLAINIPKLGRNIAKLRGNDHLV
jgi:hypothetical protein